MKAILLAAGFGTRLRPLTDTVPKCLVTIKGKPLLQIWLERLSYAGITRFIVNTHYLSEKVREFVLAGPFSKHVDISYEQVLLGTAGTLNANIDFFGGEDGLLIHADNYCLADFHAFIEVHKKRPPQCLMTMMVFQTANPSSCGIVELENGVVVRFHEKKQSPPGNLANGAVYLLSAELLYLIQHDFPTATDFSNEILPHLMGRIFTYETRETFLDIGTPQTYAAANAL